MKNTHKFTGLTGFVPDLASDTLPSDAVSGGYNLRPTVRGYEKIKGYADTDVVSGNEGTHIRFWRAGEGDSRWLSAGATTIIGSQGGGSSDMTRPGQPYNSSGTWDWTSINFNGVIIFNNGIDRPQYLTDTGHFDNFPELGERVKFRVVRSFNAYLIGLGVDTGSGYSDSDIYWSHPADPGFMPANWDYADPASDAGITTLPSVGVVLDALPLVSNNIIYKSDCTYIQSFIGGNLIFSFNKLFTEQGILATDCVVAFGRQHFVVTQDDVITHDGTRYQSIANERIRRWLFSNMHKDYKERTFVVATPDTKEIFIYFASNKSVSGICDSAAVWNWATGGWHVQEIVDATHACWGESTVGFVAEIWNNENTLWNTDLLRTWQGSAIIPDRNVGLHVSDTGKPKLQAEDQLIEGDKVVPYLGEYLRDNIPMGELSRDGVVKQDYDALKTVQSISFHAQTKTPFHVYLGLKNELDGDVVWEDHGIVDPAYSNRLDVFFTTSWLSIRIESEYGEFIIRGLTLDLALAGEYFHVPTT